MSRVKGMTVKDLVAKTPLEPFNEVGAAYNCLKALLWLVHQIETPRRHAMLEHILEIAEELQELEGLHEGKEMGDVKGEEDVADGGEAGQSAFRTHARRGL